MIKMNFSIVYRLSSDVARDTFYRELPEVIISHSGKELQKVFWMHFLRLDLIRIVLLRFGEVQFDIMSFVFRILINILLIMFLEETE